MIGGINKAGLTGDARVILMAGDLRNMVDVPINVPANHHSHDNKNAHTAHNRHMLFIGR